MLEALKGVENPPLDSEANLLELLKGEVNPLPKGDFVNALGVPKGVANPVPNSAVNRLPKGACVGKPPAEDGIEVVNPLGVPKGVANLLPNGVLDPNPSATLLFSVLNPADPFRLSPLHSFSFPANPKPKDGCEANPAKPPGSA